MYISPGKVNLQFVVIAPTVFDIFTFHHMIFIMHHVLNKLIQYSCARVYNRAAVPCSMIPVESIVYLQCFKR